MEGFLLSIIQYRFGAPLYYRHERAQGGQLSLVILCLSYLEYKNFKDQDRGYDLNKGPLDLNIYDVRGSQSICTGYFYGSTRV